MAKRRVGVEYSPSMLEPVRPGAVSPDRVLCLPTVSHFVIVNKASLSLFLSFSTYCSAVPRAALLCIYSAVCTTRKHVGGTTVLVVTRCYHFYYTSVVMQQTAHHEK